MRTPFGGEDIYTRRLGRWLAARSNKVTLMGIDSGGIRSRDLVYENCNDELHMGTPTKKSKFRKSRYGYLLYSLRAIFWILQVLKILSIGLKDKIDIINGQDSGYTGLASVIAGKILGIPVIITLHGIRYEQIESNPYVNPILKRFVLKLESSLDVFALGHAHAIFLVNSTLKYYVKQVAPKGTITTIPTAIKIKDFEYSELKRQSFRRELKIDKEVQVVAYVGRLSYEKNLFTLLNSFADATKENASLRLVIVGEGLQELELRNKAADMLIEDKVTFCGFRNDISKILSGIDIFVLPSFYESTSIALLEAMASGRAIICSDISANSKLVTNNKEALLVPPNDCEGFKNAIVSISTNQKLRSTLGNNAKTIAKQYDEDIIFPMVMSQYANCLQNFNQLNFK